MQSVEAGKVLSRYPTRKSEQALHPCLSLVNIVAIFGLSFRKGAGKGFVIQKAISENQRQTGNLLNSMYSFSNSRFPEKS